MNTPAFIVGNGLSIALSKDFALISITHKFIASLSGSDKAFLQDLSFSNGVDLNFDDFEQNFSSLETALDCLKKYNQFICSDVGEKFIKKYKLIDPELVKHEEIIERIYKQYITQILTLIQGNVRLDAITKNLMPFCNFLKHKVESSTNTYIFSLNYDLLIETILLQYLSSGVFTDFCFTSGKLAGTTIEKFDFNPQRSHEIYLSPDRNTELHHLHGSLSLFYDHKINRAVKLKSEDISLENIYKKIAQEKLPLIPAIITGGGKSDKIVQYPFDFYYRAVKDICDSGQASELYIIGYSFRDEHINDLIIRWTKNVEKYENGLRIVDYKTDETEKEEFKKFVRSQIPKRPKLPDECFIFDGVNGIVECIGTKAKEKTRT